MPWDVSILSYRISKMYIVGQRIRAQLLSNSLPSRPLPHSKAFHRSFFLDPALGRANSLSIVKPPFATYNRPSLLGHLTYRLRLLLLRRSLLSVRTSISAGLDFLRSYQLPINGVLPTSVTFAVFCPSFSKYHRFPIIGAGRKQLWRVLITYSISQQPVWRIKPRSDRGGVGR